MPNLSAAKKALRQTKKKTARNLAVTSRISYLTRMARKKMELDKKEEARKFAQEAIKQIDKAVKKKILKKNTGSRKKSHLMKKVQS